MMHTSAAKRVAVAIRRVLNEKDSFARNIANREIQVIREVLGFHSIELYMQAAKENGHKKLGYDVADVTAWGELQMMLSHALGGKDYHPVFERAGLFEEESLFSRCSSVKKLDKLHSEIRNRILEIEL